MKDLEANVCGAVVQSHAAEFLSLLHNELFFMSTLMRSHEIFEKALHDPDQRCGGLVIARAQPVQRC